MNAHQKFLQEIAGQVFGDSLTEEKACFLRRFDPQYHPENVTDKKLSRNKNIAALIKDDLKGGYCGDQKFGETIRNALKYICKKYEYEMKKDEVKIEKIFACGPGGILKSAEGEDSSKKFSPWKVVYHWVWNQKYLRWIDENGWQILQEKANPNPNWLQFLTEEKKADLLGVDRGPYLELPPPPPPEITPTITANQSLWMAIDLEYPNYQLLLLNRSKTGRLLLCPSFGYALNPIIVRPPILLPQKDSWAGQKKKNFIFRETGKEEFLAIVLETPLNLAWLTPQRQDCLPECNAERIKELFEQLEQQGNWQVFYQNFEVVASVRA